MNSQPMAVRLTGTVDKQQVSSPRPQDCPAAERRVRALKYYVRIFFADVFIEPYPKLITSFSPFLRTSRKAAVPCLFSRLETMRGRRLRRHLLATLVTSRPAHAPGMATCETYLGIYIYNS